MKTRRILAMKKTSPSKRKIWALFEKVSERKMREFRILAPQSRMVIPLLKDLRTSLKRIAIPARAQVAPQMKHPTT